MAGLPKKYAKMGFKKGWAAYKRSKSSTTTPTRRKSSSIKRRTNKQMARKKRKTYRRTTSSGFKPVQVLIGGGAYGALRAKISNAIAPLTSKIPLGTIGDEVALFSLGYIANKKMKDKTIKSVAQAAMFIEAARMGEAFADGSAFGTSNGVGGNLAFSTLG